MKKILLISLLAVLTLCGCQKEPEPVKVTTITLNVTSLSLTEGETGTIAATVSPSNADNQKILWTTNRPDIATVSNGIVTAVKEGSATITAISDDGGKTATCSVTVNAKAVGVESVSLDKTSVSLKVSETVTLIATVSPDDATDKTITWSTTDETVAAVSNGVVTANKVGTATITVKAGDKMASCSIEVAEEMSAVTGAATHISCRNAEIAGKANLPSTALTDLTFGILYSTSAEVLVSSATQIQARSFDSEYNYSINTEVLEPETTYYYRSYISQSGKLTYGEVKSFKTLDISSMIQTLDATGINPKDAVLNAFLDLTDCNYDKLEYGFEVTPEEGTSHTIKSNNHFEKQFSARDESLSGNTEYSVVAYVKLDGRSYKGEAKNFTTSSLQASVTAESSNITCKAATISGKLTVESEGSFTKSAVMYYSGTASTLEALESSGTKKTLTLGTDGAYSIVVDGLSINTKYYYCVVAKVDEIEYVTSVKTLTTLDYQTPDLVDLGLSVKWASFNLGATKPEEYGGYYQWAGLEDVTDRSIYLDWNNCPYHTGSSKSIGWTKYINRSSYGTVDNKTELDPEDDVAHVELGGKWRMPREEEFEELFNNCTSEWTTLNGVYGRKFSSNKNGNSIFLPAAGYRAYDTLYRTSPLSGDYWTSSLGISTSSACGSWFYSKSVSTETAFRFCGLFVRPVSE